VLDQSPRRFGKPTGLWTLALAAQVCHEQGLTERPLSTGRHEKLSKLA
jgi:hypothetical protein